MNKAIWLLFVICVVGVNSPSSLAQVSAVQSLAAQRDAKANSIVNSAIAFLGGSASLSTIQDSEIEGTCNSSEKTGGQSPITSTFRFVNEGDEFRYDVTLGSGTTTTILSGHGNPAAITGANVETVSYGAAANSLPYFNPALLLFRELKDPLVAFRYEGVRESQQGPVDVIETFRTGGGAPIPMTSQEWTFDEASAQPVSVSYRAPFEGVPNRFLAIEFVFSAYVSNGGLMIPASFTQITDAETSTCSIISATMNTAPADSTFNPPSSGGTE